MGKTSQTSSLCLNLLLDCLLFIPPHRSCVVSKRKAKGDKLNPYIPTLITNASTSLSHRNAGSYHKMAVSDHISIFFPVKCCLNFSLSLSLIILYIRQVFIGYDWCGFTREFENIMAKSSRCSGVELLWVFQHEPRCVCPLFL